MRYLSLKELQDAMPRLKSRPNEAQSYIAPLNAALEQFEIHTDARIAAFLAQIAHESDDLKYWQELWGPTRQQRRYEAPSDLAKRLGNTQSGDGKRFRGRGPIQLTGRSNYRRYGERLGLELEANPDQAATSEVGFLIAGLYWQENGCNALADKTINGNGLEAFADITRRINGGLTGLDDRLKRWERAKRALQVSN